MKIRSAFPGPIAFCALLVLAAAQGLAAGDAVPATAAIAVILPTTGNKTTGIVTLTATDAWAICHGSLERPLNTLLFEASSISTLRHERLHAVIERRKAKTGKEPLCLLVETPDVKLDAAYLSCFRFFDDRLHQRAANTTLLISGGDNNLVN
jgi:hypothetical protein